VVPPLELGGNEERLQHVTGRNKKRSR